MFKTQPKPKDLIPQLDILAEKSVTAEQLMTEIVSLIHQNLTKYNWVGFYMIDPKDKNMLELGPFKGSMTPHTRIPLNQGICGAAASAGKTVIVDDVNADPRYLACSTETKSEIVVPIFVRGEVKGELDVDSHFAAAFAAEDRDMCEHAAKLLGRWLETHSLRQ
jgi:L-methionine (R)-S-oxide reductase